MAESRGGRFVASLLCSTLLFVVVQPAVLGEVTWDDDGWLRTTCAQERLDLGDEFGCYGMPGLSWNNDPGAMANACKGYLEARVNASQWGVSPLSIYSPDSLPSTDHERIASQGFPIHGDLTGLDSTAWHDSEDEPVDVWDWYNLGRRGGSLEKGIGSVDVVESELLAGGIVNMYWIGRVNDATVRHDGEIIDMLNQYPDVWFTTWGEAWSSWAVKRCYSLDVSLEENLSAGTSILRFESLITQQCTAAHPEAWNVPITWDIEVEGAEVLNVSGDDGGLPSIEGDRNTKEGWFQDGSGSVFLSVVNGHKIEILVNGTNISHDVLGQTKFWNNHSSALTIAGHETSDLFKWAKRFVEDDSIRFTWLVTPRAADSHATWIPFAVVSIGLTTVVAMLYLLKREESIPVASRIGEVNSIQKQGFESHQQRSLDAEE